MSSEKDKSRDKSKVHKLSLKGQCWRFSVQEPSTDHSPGSSKLIAEFV